MKALSHGRVRVDEEQIPASAIAQAIASAAAPAGTRLRRWRGQPSETSVNWSIATNVAPASGSVATPLWCVGCNGRVGGRLPRWGERSLLRDAYRVCRPKTQRCLGLLTRRGETNFRRGGRSAARVFGNVPRQRRRQQMGSARARGECESLRLFLFEPAVLDLDRLETFFAEFAAPDERDDEHVFADRHSFEIDPICA